MQLLASAAGLATDFASVGKLLTQCLNVSMPGPQLGSDSTTALPSVAATRTSSPSKASAAQAPAPAARCATDPCPPATAPWECPGQPHIAPGPSMAAPRRSTGHAGCQQGGWPQMPAQTLPGSGQRAQHAGSACSGAHPALEAYQAALRQAGGHKPNSSGAHMLPTLFALA